MRPWTSIGAGFAALLVAPALALSSGPGDTFTARDLPNRWESGGDADTTATVAPGDSVAFTYPSGGNFHNVVFTGEQPASCRDVAQVRPAPWSGECEFKTAGRYDFVCGVHPEMTGRVIVQRPAPSSTPTPTPTPTPADDAPAAPQPGETATPVPGGPATQTSLTVRLASGQRGTRVRGRVEVLQAGSRLEVTLLRGRVRAGRIVRTAGAGRMTFSVPLDARARRALRSRGRLELRVTIALTPPGASTIARSQRVRLRR